MYHKGLKLILASTILLPVGSVIGQNLNKAEASESWVNKDLKAPAITKYNLKALKNGIYTYNGVYLGMSKKDVMNKIGYGKYSGGTHDANIKDDGVVGTFYYTMYGKNNNLALHFYDKDPKKSYNNTRLSQMDFIISNEKGMTKKNIEKYLGAADEYDGNIKKDTYIYRTYGQLDVAYKKDTSIKGWKVIGLTYHSPRNNMGVFEHNIFNPRPDNK